MSILDNAQVRLTNAPSDQLLFHYMHGEEELGRPFRYDLTLFSLKGDLGPKDLLGKTLAVELDLPENPMVPNDGHRYFHGYVAHCARQGRHRHYHIYSAIVRPWIWLLAKTRNCRIFQNKTIPEIIKEVFRKHQLTDFKESLTGTYAPRDYVVQYRETDLEFVTRLMAQEGIYYFFTHEPTKHVLVLADSFSAHKEVKGYEKVPFHGAYNRGNATVDHIDMWHSEQEIQSGTVVLKDFNFKTPKEGLLAKRSAPNEHAMADFEIYDYPGKYLTSSEGEAYARLRHEEVDVDYDRRIGGGNVRGLGGGCIFNLIPLSKYPGSVIIDAAAAATGDDSGGEHLADEEYREYLVTTTSFHIQGPSYESQAADDQGELFRCTLTAIDSNRAFRMKEKWPKPVVYGPQTATVVGDTGEDITTDPYGQVKVKFHWDRRIGNEEDPSKVDKNGNDPNSSCWVRVAQMWAGTKFGAINIPRIGDEVIVDFLEGDPDRPIITGRVYNADNMPPYTLPDNKTQTGVKTRSTKGGNPDNFNELRFEDKKGKEELHIQAERDMSTYVKRNQSTRVDGDRSVSVGGNQSTTVTKNETQTYQAERSMTVAKTNKDEITGAHTGIYHAGRTETVEKGDTLTVKDSNKTVDVIGAYDITVKDHLKVAKASTSMTIDDNFVVDASGKVDMHNPGTSVVGEGTTLTLNGNSAVTITCGASSISMKSDGTIEITGKTVKIGNATNNAAFDPQGTTINGVKITSAAVGIQEISGALIKVG